MIWPLIEFGSFFFFVLAGLFVFIEACYLYNDEGSTAFGLFIVCMVAAFALVGSTPEDLLRYVAIYFVGAVVWVPTYWYLYLLRNRRGLVLSEDDYSRMDYGFYKEDSGAKKWYPKHPSRDALLANGTMWVISAPLFLTKDWVSLIIEWFCGLMGRIQKSLVVVVPK